MTTLLSVGTKVYFGRPNGEQTLGTIVKVNPTKYKVRQDEERGSLRIRSEGTVWSVPFHMVTPVGATTAAVVVPPSTVKRSESAILKDIQIVYNGLSPENLWMDGEATRAQANRRAAALRARLRLLETEIGRKVSEAEAYGEASHGLSEHFTPARWAPVAPKFKVGDKVMFSAKGRTIAGFVKRVSAKTVSVLPEGSTNPNGHWRVSPSLLSKVA